MQIFVYFLINQKQEQLHFEFCPALCRLEYFQMTIQAGFNSNYKNVQSFKTFFNTLLRLHCVHKLETRRFDY